ncbi:hypothetical protein HDV00_012358 [Rhizophlyctis rosea]|nr:hypothetical protein HDV00_012358 [Rhizophlyctis rosea]
MDPPKESNADFDPGGKTTPDSPHTSVDVTEFDPLCVKREEVTPDPDVTEDAGVSYSSHTVPSVGFGFGTPQREGYVSPSVVPSMTEAWKNPKCESPDEDVQMTEAAATAQEDHLEESSIGATPMETDMTASSPRDITYAQVAGMPKSAASANMPEPSTSSQGHQMAVDTHSRSSSQAQIAKRDLADLRKESYRDTGVISWFQKNISIWTGGLPKTAQSLQDILAQHNGKGINVFHYLFELFRKFDEQTRSPSSNLGKEVTAMAQVVLQHTQQIKMVVDCYVCMFCLLKLKQYATIRGCNDREVKLVIFQIESQLSMRRTLYAEDLANLHQHLQANEDLLIPLFLTIHQTLRARDSLDTTHGPLEEPEKNDHDFRLRLLMLHFDLLMSVIPVLFTKGKDMREVCEVFHNRAAKFMGGPLKVPEVLHTLLTQHGYIEVIIRGIGTGGIRAQFLRIFLDSFARDVRQASEKEKPKHEALCKAAESMLSLIALITDNNVEIISKFVFPPEAIHEWLNMLPIELREDVKQVVGSVIEDNHGLMMSIDLRALVCLEILLPKNIITERLFLLKAEDAAIKAVYDFLCLYQQELDLPQSLDQLLLLERLLRVCNWMVIDRLILPLKRPSCLDSLKMGSEGDMAGSADYKQAAVTLANVFKKVGLITGEVDLRSVQKQLRDAEVEHVKHGGELNAAYQVFARGAAQTIFSNLETGFASDEPSFCGNWAQRNIVVGPEMSMLSKALLQSAANSWLKIRMTSDKDFSGKIQRLTSELQCDRAGLEKLNRIEAVYQMIEPLEKIRSLKNLGDTISKRMPTVDKTVASTSILEALAEQLPDVKFKVFVDQQACDNNQAENISKFLAVTEMAKQVYQTRIRLEFAGHPNFHAEPGEVLLPTSVQENRMILDNLHNMYDDWEATLSEAQAHTPRLWLLGRNERASFIKLFLNPMRPDDLRRNLRPYLLIAMPDLEGDIVESILTKADLRPRKKPAKIFGPYVQAHGIEVFSIWNIECLTKDDLAAEKVELRSCLVLERLEVVQGESSAEKSVYIQRQLDGLVSRGDVADKDVYRVAINEDWMVATFCSIWNNIAADSPSIALHFNVSAYASYQKLDQFFYDLLLFGLIRNDKTGEILHCGSKLRWYIFVELSRAPEVSGMTNLSTAEDVKRGLPVIFSCQTHSGWKTEPFEVTPEVRLVCSFLDALHKIMLQDVQWERSTRALCADARAQQALQESIHTIAQYVMAVQENGDDERVRATAASIFTNIDGKWLPGSMNIFFKLFAIKLQGLQKFASYCCEFMLSFKIKRPEELTSTITGTADVNVDRFLARTWITLFLQESAFLARAEIDLNIVTSSCVMSLCQSAPIPTVVFIDFTPGPAPEYLTRNEVIRNPARLRSAVALQLGIVNTSKMASVISQLDYIMTPTLAVKLLAIHSRRLVGQNVVLSGGTGVGKTEMLEVYSLLMNLDSNVIPDLFGIVLEQFQAELPYISADARGAAGQLLLQLPKMLLGECMSDEKPVDIIKELIRVIYQTTEANFAIMALRMVQKLSGALKEYPLIKVRSGGILETIESVDNLAAANVIPDSIRCRNADDLEEVLEEFLSADFQGLLFHPLRMHAGLSATMIKSDLAAICSAASNASGVSMLLFIDEFNTSSSMGIMKELLCDPSLDGTPLPANLFIVAAMNPHAISSDKNTADFTGTNSQTSSYEYIVRPAHASMHTLMLQFGEFEGAEEEDFVHMAVNAGLAGSDESIKRIFAEAILLGQRFIRAAKIHRLKVSIRDVMRAVKLFQFFVGPGSEMLVTNNMPHRIGARKCQQLAALVLSITLAYGYRLEGKNRSTLTKRLTENWKSLFRGVDCAEVVQASLQNVYNELRLPACVAPTQVLIENLFTIIACIGAEIPLTIVGPAGSSKTLASSSVFDNMKGQNATSSLLRKFKRVHMFRYQCSVYTTDKQLEAVYLSAVDRQRTLAAFSEKRDISCVLLDEAGLPQEMQMSSKVIHFYTDKPEVATVILSNNILDAAKTNRTALLQHPATVTVQDMTVLVRSLVFSRKQSQHLHADQERLIKALCACFTKSNQFTTHPKRELFQQRDSIYFLRRLRLHSNRIVKRDDDLYVSGDALLDSIRRKFNGIWENKLQELIDSYFDELSGADKRIVRPTALPFDNSVEPLLQNLTEAGLSREDVNSSASRFAMIIDPTNNEIAVSILLGLLKKRGAKQETYEVVQVGDFVGDRKLQLGPTSL